MSDIPLRKDSDLDRVRNIINGDNHEMVKELHDRITDKHKRSHDIAEILPQAIKNIESQQRQVALGEALSNPLETAVELSIKRNPKTFSDLLYPVILPSIRRAVNEMLRSFVERIDRTISERFSLKSLRWRFESLRTGIPYPEILLRHSILYSVEQALLIHRESGLLIQHAYTESSKQTDSDAVSGMLIAIERFVQDTFVNNDELLQRVTIGDHIVYLVDGPHALLACVVRGLPPASFLDEMREILEQIHAESAESLKNFSGDKNSMKALQTHMDKCLQVEYKEDPAEKANKYQQIVRISGLLLGVLLFILVSYWMFNNIQENRIRDYVIQLNEQPGIKILDHYKSNGQWQLEGLKDPSIQIVALPEESFFLDPEKITLNLSAFQGMDKSIVLDRVSNFLALPEGLNASLEESRLKISGAAPVSWFMDAANRVNLPDGIRQLDLSGVELEQQEVMSFMDQMLRPPSAVSSNLTENGIRFSGQASNDWIQSLNALTKKFAGNLLIDTSAVQSVEENRLLMLMDVLSQKKLDFIEKTVLSSQSERIFLEVAMIAAEIGRLAAKLDKKFQIVITGYTDEQGSIEYNQSLRQDRAKHVLEKLKLYGVNHRHLSVFNEHPEENLDSYNHRQAGFLAKLI